MTDMSKPVKTVAGEMRLSPQWIAWLRERQEQDERDMESIRADLRRRVLEEGK